MARYKDYNYQQSKLIPISFSRQILPCSFEYTLSHLIDHEIDLTAFHAKYRNDETGAPAYDPAILLKIVLYAYSRGITSSRDIERCCVENIIFMALSADTHPHFTTIADFVSSMGEQIATLFREVLMICDEMGLIGREMFAIDGVKLPSNASKEWSGTREELGRKAEKMDQAVRFMLDRHRAEDNSGGPSKRRQKEEQQIETLQRNIRKIRDWLDDHDDKPGKSGKPLKSNITDNESAKMKTGHGVIQGYIGVAAVDSKHQVVVHAEAFGEAQEHDLLLPMVEAVRANLGKNTFEQGGLAADSGYHSEKNVKELFEQGIDGYVADTQFRKRDPRFATADRHKGESRRKYYAPKDFIYDEASQSCICPAGRKLYRNGSHCLVNGYEAVKFQGSKSACVPCTQRRQCLRSPEKTATRQVYFFKGRSQNAPETYTHKMKRKIDTPEGRHQYSRRLGIVEPVFGNLCSAIGLNRFSLRGKLKVDIQWKLYNIVQNLLKIHRYGAVFG